MQTAALSSLASQEVSLANRAYTDLLVFDRILAVAAPPLESHTRANQEDPQRQRPFSPRCKAVTRWRSKTWISGVILNIWIAIF